MTKKIVIFLILVILITFSMSNIAYAQAPIQPSPFGPKVSELKNKEDILRSLEDIKKVRATLTVINISANTPQGELKAIDTSLQGYIKQLQNIKVSLEKHANTYSNSFPYVFFSEQISFIADSYIISIRHQQVLVRALANNIEEASKLFYLSYMIPVYNYLTLGDEMTAYIQTYFVYG
ncbi:hypothetical protein [Clostridium sp. YIM B02551]|uniref:hypothetical protein n=1 Tax=Clostridium sp. YIM B02551 TaxID=2910679 RepID=UPI001EEB90C7|nr:hypothetical protein [Clostridium sp. YIM B02551]